MSVRVLIVDDSVIVRDELRHHLECIGCEVVAEAANTGQALALFRTVSPSLVIIDTAVPQTGGIGGLALLRIMRREDPAVQVLVLGLLPLPEVRKSFLSEGAVDFLIKPSLLNGFDYMRRRLEELFPELKRLAPAANRHLDPESMLEHSTIIGR
ncbi:MAG: response regulator [Deltaproteobacteria bacterium]|nr:response regulator [Deltaproteobacteria bacterium]